MKASDLWRSYILPDRLPQRVPGKRVFMKKKDSRSWRYQYSVRSPCLFDIQSRYHGGDRVNRGNRIADGHRRNLNMLALVCPAAGALGDYIVSGPMAVRSPVAKRGNGTVNDVIFDFPRRFIIKRQSFHDPRGKIFHDNITFFDQPMDYRHAFWIFNIDTDAFFSRDSH
jgi:hypothetical protein